MAYRSDSSRLTGGLILLGLGVLLLLSNLGYFSRDVWDLWWPLILIAIGVIILLRRRREAPASPIAPPGGEASPPLPEVSPAATPGGERRREFPTGAVILIGLGLAFLLDDLIGGDSLPALVLIAIGAALLLRDWSRRNR